MTTIKGPTWVIEMPDKETSIDDVISTVNQALKDGKTVTLKDEGGSLLSVTIAKLASNQEPLGPEFEKILMDNLDILYVRD